MEQLKSILIEVLRGYAVKGFNGRGYLMSDSAETVFAVIDIGQVRGKTVADASLIVRLIDDQIIIDRDLNDKILLDALLQAGIPRHQIVLTYADETPAITQP